MSAKDLLRKARDQAMTEIGGAMETTIAIAYDLKLKDSAQKVGLALKHMREDTFRVMLVGRFKNGKSTLLNALLGRPARTIPGLDGRGPMPVDDLPCTATLTAIQYADVPSVRVHKFPGDDGKARVEDWTFNRYLSEAVLSPDPQENEERFRDIMAFEVHYPAELCKEGVTLIDAPGTDEHPQRTAITQEALEQCDAAIIVYRSEPAYGEHEVEFAQKLVAGSGTKIFTITNMFLVGKSSESLLPRIKRLAWSKLVRTAYPSKGPYEEDVNMAAYDMYFVDALSAFDGKMKGDPARIKQSGLEEFEERLGRFLIDERYHAKLKSFVTKAEAQVNAIRQSIIQRSTALLQDTEKLKHSAREIEPQMAAIDQRRDKLPAIVDECRDRCKAEIRLSFDQLMFQIRAELPAHLDGQELTSLAGLKGAAGLFFKQKASKECFDQASAFIQSKVEAWASSPANEPGAQSAIGRSLKRMEVDLKEEADRISTSFNAIHFKLSGWEPPQSGTNGESGVNYWLVGAGVLTGIPILAGAGLGGLKGMAGTIGGAIVGMVALSILHVVAAPIVIPAMIVSMLTGATIFGSTGLAKAVRASTVAQLEKRWTELAAKAQPTLDAAVDKSLDQVRDTAVAAIIAKIEEEKDAIRRILDDNQRSQTEKKALVQTLDTALLRVNASMDAMKAGLARFASVKTM
ncbi:MAG: dynamin family protein [Phycisphaeraceae bacterium]|nr:dynamin family protein [Phycisphaeraceae bacterium]